MTLAATIWDRLAAVGQAAEALCACVEIPLVLGGLIAAWFELRRGTKAQRLGIVWEMFRELGDAEARKARRFVFQERSVYEGLEDGSVDLRSLDPEAIEAAQNVGNVLDRLGYAVVKGLVSEDVVLDGYNCLVMRSWIVLEPFVNALRRERGERTYQKGFEELASRAFRNPDYPSREEVEFGCV
jgi:hypothetical protein